MLASRERWYLGTPLDELGVIARPGPPREDQKWPAGEWIVWLMLSGRGSGKTRTGSETVLDWAISHVNIRINIVARTIGDCRSTLFEGESGILSCLPSEYRDNFNKSLLELTLPGNIFIKGFGAEEPLKLRGTQCHYAWCDELASWRAKKSEGMSEHAWDQLLLGTRLKCNKLDGSPGGERILVTTTPKPVKIIRQLVNDPNVRVTTASTYDNAANLSRAFISEIIRKYEGTRLGKQELYAQILEAVEGALWNLDLIRELDVEIAPEMKRIVVGVDPAATSTEESNETGIVAVGHGYDDHGYVLEDWTVRDKPVEWARKAVALYKKLKADAIVAEINNGGEMVESTIRMVDPNVKIIVVHATRGKAKRAEPVSALYEQKRFHHVVPSDTPDKFKDLEEQMTNYTANDEYGLPGSPDRMDAMVWAAHQLMVQGMDGAGVLEYYRQLSVEANAKRVAEVAQARGEKVPEAAVAVLEPVPSLKPKPLAQDPDYIRSIMQGRKRW
jgi:phage terminase large subunit-like protein